jgi:hypothetical protein
MRVSTSTSALACVLLASALLLGVVDRVDAHMRLITPIPRSDSDSAKGAGPCYGTGKLAGQNPTTYVGGTEVDVVVEETVNHSGWIRVAFAKPTTGDTPTMEEFDVNVLRMVEDPSASGAMPEQRTIKVTIPNYACDDCVLQVIQVMGRFGSNYHMCADIKISAGAGTAYVVGTCAPDRNDNPVTTAGFSDQQYACGGAYPGKPTTTTCSDESKLCPGGTAAKRNADCTFAPCIECYVGTEEIAGKGGGATNVALSSAVVSNSMVMQSCATSCKMTMLKVTDTADTQGAFTVTYVGTCLPDGETCVALTDASASTDCYASSLSTTDGPKRVPEPSVGVGCHSCECTGCDQGAASTSVASVATSLVMAAAAAAMLL